MIKHYSQKYFTFFTLFLLINFAVTSAAQIQSAIVDTETLKLYDFEERLKVQGNIESVKVAKVSARIPGPIEAIFVSEGDLVEAGITPLFQIDSIKLQKNVEIRQQELAIARLSLKEKQARLKQANADFEKAQSDLNRFRLLWEDNSTSADNYEKALLKHKVSQAAVEHTQALIDLSGEQLKQAELALRIAEKDFADSTVYAPISGRVVTKLQEPGETAAPGKPVILIKDPEKTEISAHLPAIYYHRVKEGETQANISTEGCPPFKQKVSFKSPVINPTLRTFQVKCLNEGGKNALIPGALAELTFILSRETSLGVESGAILNRAGGKVVFIARNGTAHMVSIETGIENDGRTQIISKGLKENDVAIIRGHNLLNEGQKISLRKEGK